MASILKATRLGFMSSQKITKIPFLVQIVKKGRKGTAHFDGVRHYKKLYGETCNNFYKTSLILQIAVFKKKDIKSSVKNIKIQSDIDELILFEADEMSTLLQQPCNSDRVQPPRRAIAVECDQVFILHFNAEGENKQLSRYNNYTVLLNNKNTVGIQYMKIEQGLQIKSFSLMPPDRCSTDKLE